ncbi:MAG: dihydroorotase [Deltaproteobacteria bacterium]|nr:dihydroorotase [Deltaproteobacteria bacterium]
MSLLIRGGRLVAPLDDFDAPLDVLVEGSQIKEIGNHLAVDDQTRVIDAAGCLVVPGLIDGRAQLREPGYEYKETLLSGGRAAAAGGFTTVCCLPNTSPINDTRAVTEYIVKRAAAAPVNIHPIGAMTVGLQGEQLCEYADMREAGIVAVSDGERSVMNGGLMRRVLEYAATFGLPAIQHCEDRGLSAKGVMHEGEAAARIGLKAQPPQAESALLARDLELVALVGARYHMAHLSTRQALAHVRRAKQAELPVTCEVTPHHLILTDEACAQYDTATKVTPPLRSSEDLLALRGALSDGTIDMVVSDHAPQATIDKELEYDYAESGISALETVVPLMLTLWRDGVISLPRFVELLSCNPAKLFGLPKGRIRVGAEADISVIDPEHQWTVDPHRFLSLGKVTPFAGRHLRGAARFTIVAGQVVYDSIRDSDR